MKYLKLFNTHSEYEAFIETSDFIKPNVTHCVQEDDVHYSPMPYDYSKDYLTFVARENSTFQLSRNAVSYSLDDGETWTELAADTASPTVMAGNKIMWKGELTPSSSYGVGTFSATGNFDVQGNIMSLLFGDNYKGKTSLTGKSYVFKKLFNPNTKIINAENLSLPATTLAFYCYNEMFNGCTNLVTAPELPATTLKSYCYDFMFRNCTSLVNAPKLPATTLDAHCYYLMFINCTSLVNAPKLPATTLKDSCYSGMFYNCSSLTMAPQLPATTLATYCYTNMFADCTNLTTAPELPATTLTSNCYSGMFSGCTNLTTAPELPAKTLKSNCYGYMFHGCTSLVTAPVLPATTLAQSCYNLMFDGCTSLSYIKAMFTTTPSTTYTDCWVRNVSSSGTFVKNSAAQWNVTGNNGVPTGWTVQTASE